MPPSLPPAFPLPATHRIHTVLLIDDDDEDRYFFREALQETDASIVCLEAEDGVEALTILRSEGIPLPDLIFLDLNMPRMDGRQCLIEIKNTEQLRHLPVIICTTSNQPEHKAEMKQLGAAYYMTKPSGPDALSQSIAYVLSQYELVVSALPKPDLTLPLT